MKLHETETPVSCKSTSTDPNPAHRQSQSNYQAAADEAAADEAAAGEAAAGEPAAGEALRQQQVRHSGSSR